MAQIVFSKRIIEKVKNREGVYHQKPDNEVLFKHVINYLKLVKLGFKGNELDWVNFKERLKRLL
jgi:hypothetical protein